MEKEKSIVKNTKDYAFEAYITNLGKYNEGELVGEWVKFPVTNEEMQDVFKRIGIDRHYEEWFITDYNCPDIKGFTDLLGEYENLSELNYLAGKIMELDEGKDYLQAVLDTGENTGSVQELINLTENMDCFDYLPGVTDDYDLGYYLVEESGCYDTKAIGVLSNYIDYESFGRDIRINEGGIFTKNGYVCSNGSPLVEVYNGNIESIPDRFQIENEKPDLLAEQQQLINTAEQPTSEPTNIEIAEPIIEPMDMDFGFDMNM